MLMFKGETEEKYEKLLSEVQLGMNEYKRKYEAENAKLEQMKDKMSAM